MYEKENILQKNLELIRVHWKAHLVKSKSPCLNMGKQIFRLIRQQNSVPTSFPCYIDQKSVRSTKKLVCPYLNKSNFDLTKWEFFSVDGARMEVFEDHCGAQSYCRYHFCWIDKTYQRITARDHRSCFWLSANTRVNLISSYLLNEKKAEIYNLVAAWS